MPNLRVGVVGASGYTGLELCRLLLAHPQVELTRLYSRQYDGQHLHEVFPHLMSPLNLKFETFSPLHPPDVDLLFLAVPHGQTHAYIGQLQPKIKWIIDLSADFRLQDLSIFSDYYGVTHATPTLVKEAVYGIPELHRTQIANAHLCANPGCYATCVTLGLAPLARSGQVKGTVIIDAKSGVSGAGRSLKETSLFCEVNEDFTAYSTHRHRHVPEMEAQLNIPILFSPHLIPINRGMLASMYVPVDPALTQSELDTLYTTAYASEPFVQLVKSGQVHTRSVAGSNHCLISTQICPNSGYAVVFSAIDNLLKGASGQAIQNMNIMMGLPEQTGLEARASFL